MSLADFFLTWSKIMIISRNSEGVVTDGNISVTIPKDRSLLSVLNSKNVIDDGSSFNEDGYIYHGGIRIRKWFTKIRDHRGYIWHPKLDDIVYCEAKFHKMSQYRDNCYKANWPTILSNIPEKCYYFCNKGKNEGWKILEKNEYGISTTWVSSNEIEQDKINQQAGDLWESYDKKSSVVGDRYWMFYKVFLECVNKRFWKKFSREVKIINFTVNGRDYFIKYDRDDVEFIGMNNEILKEVINV
jgi:hypothetical protein